MPPILQFGQSTIEEFDTNIDKGNKIYYLGAFEYRFAKNSVELKEKEPNIKQRLKKDINLNTSQWTDKLETQTTSLQSFATSSTGKILNVTRVWQRKPGVTWPSSACGPATGAMITNYYGNVAGYNIKTSSNYGGDAGLINHLYNEMGSTALGTTANQWGI